MCRAIQLSILILALTLKVAAQSSPKVFLGNVIPSRILAIGDSITWGAGYDGGYRGILETRIRAAGGMFSFVGSDSENSKSLRSKFHEGHGGWSTLDLINGKSSAPSAGKVSTWLTQSHPDMVLVMTGTNDDIWVSRQEWTAKYEALLDKIFAYNKNMRVILASIPKSYAPRTGKATGEALCYDIVKTVVASRKARGFRIGFADTYTSFDYNSDLSDDYHPNKSGYTKIADAFFNQIEKGV